MTTKFILFGFARTGTTLLLSLLNSHPEIKSFGEVFNKGNKEFSSGVFPAYDGNDDVLISYNEFLNKKMGTVQQYVDMIYNTHNSFKAVGFKLIWDHLHERPEILEELDFSGIKIIYITRNVVASQVSAMRAVVLGSGGEWDKDKTNNLKNEKIYVDPKIIKDCIEGSTPAWKFFYKFLKDRQLKHIRIKYEDLIINFNGNSTKKILSFIDVNPDKKLHTPSRKVSPDSMIDSISNYDEVYNYMCENNYREYLF